MGMLILAVVWDGFMRASLLPAMVIFTLFMAVTASRAIAVAAVNRQVPEPWQRADFIPLQSVWQKRPSGGCFFYDSD